MTIRKFIYVVTLVARAALRLRWLRWALALVLVLVLMLALHYCGSTPAPAPVPTPKSLQDIHDCPIPQGCIPPNK